MLSVVIAEPGTVEVRERDIPERRAGEALLRVLWGGICGSDLGTYRGTFLYARYPRVPGHEFSAEVVEVDDNECGIVPGMVVTANPYINCGRCYACRRGFVNCCQANETLGAQRDGAFSQYLTMPVERVYPGRGIDARTLALVEPFAISHHAVTRADVRAGDRVLVVGAGAIGVFAAIAARLAGARVWVTDVAQDKLAGLDEFGVEGVFPGGDAFSAGVSAIAPDGFDVVIEAVGLPATFQNAIDAAAHRGRVVQVGVGRQPAEFYYTVLQTKELDVYGSRNALKSDFDELIGLIASGRVDIAGLISAQYDLEDAAEAFRAAAGHRKTLVRIG